jgi:hypothetical protein
MKIRKQLRRAWRLAQRLAVLWCLPGAMLLDVCEWQTRCEWPTARAWFWPWVAVASFPCWVFGLVIIRMMEWAPVSWSPWSGLTFGRASRGSGILNIETNAAANVGLGQNAAVVQIHLRFDTVALMWALLQCLGLAAYIVALLAIKLLVLLVMKPWCLLLWLFACMCGHFWLQDKEFLEIQGLPELQNSNLEIANADNGG